MTLASWYVKYIYSFVSDALGRCSDAILFPLGEILLYAGIGMLAAELIVLGISLAKHIRHREPLRACKTYRKIFRTVCLVLAVIYLFNWLIPFLTVRVESEDTDRTYTVEELEILRDYLTEQLNAAAEQVERDADGRVVYCEDPDAEVEKALQNLSAEYPLLIGYYPSLKTAIASDILDWMDIGGYTYPYTMEVTVNRYIDALYYPTLAAHEQCHHQGYYREDDATYLSFLACAGSADTRLVYSAYDSIYSYVNNAYVRNLVQALGTEAARERYLAQPQVSEQVKADEQAAMEAREATYQANVNQTLEHLAPAAKAAAEVGWNTQSALLGEANYGGVVKLLLQHYDGILYESDIQE